MAKRDDLLWRNCSHRCSSSLTVGRSVNLGICMEMTRQPDRFEMKEEGVDCLRVGDEDGERRVKVGVMFQRVALDGSHGTSKYVQEKGSSGLECCWTWLAQKRSQIEAEVKLSYLTRGKVQVQGGEGKRKMQ